MKAWKAKRDEVLAEMIRTKGRGIFTGNTCSCCGCAGEQEDGQGLCRCKECFSQELVCADCCVTMHCNHPLHCIEVCCVGFLFLFANPLIRFLGMDRLILPKNNAVQARSCCGVGP